LPKALRKYILFEVENLGKKLLAILFGLLISCAVVVGADVTIGLLKIQRWGNPGDIAKPGRTNQDILGHQATAHGIFPPMPTPPSGHLQHEGGLSEAEKLFPRKLEYTGPDAKFLNWRNIGFLIPVAPFEGRLARGSRLIYDAQYTLDKKWARRVVPDQGQKQAARFLIFVGCSYTFGEGLTDNQTLPYYTGKLLPRTRSYNYAFPGASTGEAWLRLRKIELGQEIPESTGTVAYIFIDDHVARTLGKMSVIGNWGPFKAHFFLAPNGSVQTDGTFEDAQPVRTWFFQQLYKSNIVRNFHLDFPWTSESDWKLYNTILKNMRDEAKRLNSERFVVIFYPHSILSTKIIPLLEKDGISYIDYSHWRLEDLTQGPAGIPGDGHPTAEANQILAQSVAEILGR
jgi:hypothetical protein